MLFKSGPSHFPFVFIRPEEVFLVVHWTIIISPRAASFVPREYDILQKLYFGKLSNTFTQAPDCTHFYS